MGATPLDRDAAVLLQIFRCESHPNPGSANDGAVQGVRVGRCMLQRSARLFEE